MHIRLLFACKQNRKQFKDTELSYSFISILVFKVSECKAVNHAYSNQVQDGKGINERLCSCLCLCRKLLHASAAISVTLLSNSCSLSPCSNPILSQKCLYYGQ